MQTQAHMGRNKLIDRLTAQVGDRATAIRILEKRGMLVPGTETLTEKGRQRDAMTAEERAIDRAAQRSGRDKSEYEYNPSTNRATLRQGRR